MLKIRLQRVGRKHEPVFRLVVVDSHRSTKSGKFIEILGNFDSRRGEEAKFDSEKIKHWITQGAKTSDTVHNMLVSRKIIEGKKINVSPKKKPIKTDPPQSHPASSGSDGAQQSTTNDQPQSHGEAGDGAQRAVKEEKKAEAESEELKEEKQKTEEEKKSEISQESLKEEHSTDTQQAPTKEAPRNGQLVEAEKPVETLS